MKKTKDPKAIDAKELDQKFDDNEDITPYLKLNTAKMEYATMRINIDMPKNMVERMDQEANRIGVPRTSLLKMWVADRIDHLD
ncbi:MAG: putative DNA binding CopG/RHH family protein [Candidatus Omnitrophota bacterium]|jgi:predicted DNA binding CopG/RHH family protein